MSDRTDWRAERRKAIIAEGLEGIALYAPQYFPHLADGLERYLRDRIATGSFLRAVLENDLKEAIGRAHPSFTMEQMKFLIEMLNNYFPGSAFGSPDKVASWLQKDETE